MCLERDAMPSARPKPLGSFDCSLRTATTRTPWAWAVAQITTIRGQIFLAFLAMTMITAGLGVYVAQGITTAGLLVDNTFDKSLMSVSYARAAAAEFASMQAVLTRRWLMTDLPDREELDQRIEALSSSLDEDLAIAAERAQSPRAAAAARAVRAAIDTWQVARHRLVADAGNPEVWRVLDES